MIITVNNHGPLITASNYWSTPHAALGNVWCSVNSGAIRVLVPQVQRPLIQEFRKCRHVVLSRGPWLEMGLPDAVEIMLEDGSDDPFCLHLSPESFDLLPGEPPPEQEWVLSVWDSKKSRPHKAVERVCHWRRVPHIPWGKEWTP